MTAHPDARAVLSALRAERVRQGLRQADVAERCGILQQDISHLENRATDPRLGTVLRVAQALGCRLLLAPAGWILMGPAPEDTGVW